MKREDMWVVSMVEMEILSGQKIVENPMNWSTSVLIKYHHKLEAFVARKVFENFYRFLNPTWNIDLSLNVPVFR